MAEAPGRRSLALVALWTLVMGATAFGSGCYGRNCDGDVQLYGRKEGEGRLLSADAWESGPIDGKWLPFPRQRIWIFDLTKLGNDRLVLLFPLRRCRFRWGTVSVALRPEH